jgi:hypothetical protein
MQSSRDRCENRRGPRRVLSLVMQIERNRLIGVHPIHRQLKTLSPHFFSSLYSA